MEEKLNQGVHSSCQDGTKTVDMLQQEKQGRKNKKVEIKRALRVRCSQTEYKETSIPLLNIDALLRLVAIHSIFQAVQE